jgi:hypothetical protein
MAEIKPCGSHDSSALGVPTLRVHRQGVWAGLRIQTRAPKTSQEHPYRRQGKFGCSICVVNKSSHVEIMLCLSTVIFVHAIHSKLFRGRSSTAAAAASANARLSHYPPNTNLFISLFSLTSLNLTSLKCYLHLLS